jgi:hypothetical protein
LPDVALKFQEIWNLRSISLGSFIDEWFAKTKSITPLSKSFNDRWRRDNIHHKDNRIYFFRDNLSEKTLMLNSYLELGYTQKLCVWS